jgi:hypothetical protein
VCGGWQLNKPKKERSADPRQMNKMSGGCSCQKLLEKFRHTGFAVLTDPAAPTTLGDIIRGRSWDSVGANHHRHLGPTALDFSSLSGCISQRLSVWPKWHLRARHASRSGHSATYWQSPNLDLAGGWATSNGAVTFHWSAPRRQSNAGVSILTADRN